MLDQNSSNWTHLSIMTVHMWTLSPVTFLWLVSGLSVSKDLAIPIIDSQSHGLSWFITQSGLCKIKFLYVMIASVEIYACFGPLAYFNISFDCSNY